MRQLPFVSFDAFWQPQSGHIDTFGGPQSGHIDTFRGTHSGHNDNLNFKTIFKAKVKQEYFFNICEYLLSIY